MQRCLGAIRDFASEHKIDVEISSDRADFSQKARRAVDDQIERIIVVGGDGTLHYAAQESQGSDSALGIVPLGTGNDLAAVLKIPTNPNAALSFALGAEPRAIDVAVVGGRCVLGIVSAGLDSIANQFANERLAGWPPALVYPLAAIRSLATYRMRHLRVASEDLAIDCLAMSVAIANSCQYGGGMKIAPHARIDDGVLDGVVIGEVSKLECLRTAPRVFSGTHISHRAVRTFETRDTTVFADTPLPLVGDGELLGHLTSEGTTVTVASSHLKVLAN